MYDFLFVVCVAVVFGQVYTLVILVREHALRTSDGRQAYRAYRKRLISGKSVEEVAGALYAIVMLWPDKFPDARAIVAKRVELAGINRLRPIIRRSEELLETGAGHVTRV